MVWDNSKWYHLAAVHGAGDGSYQKIYVDGELLIEQQRSGPINWDNHMLVFGARHHNNNFGWISNVFLDEVRFYNRALSAQEVEVQAGAFLNKIIGSYGPPLVIKLRQIAVLIPMLLRQVLFPLDLAWMVPLVSLVVRPRYR